MSEESPLERWNSRFATDDYLFGKAPNAFLAAQRHLLLPGQACLAVADGEGRNGAWLAKQGLDVLSIDFSPVAQAKARKLAAESGVALRFELADLHRWAWGKSRFDVIAAIFVQFADPVQRAAMFANIKRALKPGGLLLLQGYTPKQLDYKTGGPPWADHMYTPELLRAAFADMTILHLAAHDEVIREGTGHSGMSALIDLVARKP